MISIGLYAARSALGGSSADVARASGGDESLSRRLDGALRAQHSLCPNRRILAKSAPFVVDQRKRVLDRCHVYDSCYNATPLEKGADPSSFGRLKHRADATQIQRLMPLSFSFSHGAISNGQLTNCRFRANSIAPSTGSKTLPITRISPTARYGRPPTLGSLLSSISILGAPAPRTTNAGACSRLIRRVYRNLGPAEPTDEAAPRYHILGCLHAGGIRAVAKGEPAGEPAPHVGIGTPVNNWLHASNTEEDRPLFQQIYEKACRQEQPIWFARADLAVVLEVAFRRTSFASDYEASPTTTRSSLTPG